MDLTHFTLCKPNHLPQLPVLALKHTQHIQDISGGTFACLLIRSSAGSFFFKMLNPRLSLMHALDDCMVVRKP